MPLINFMGFNREAYQETIIAIRNQYEGNRAPVWGDQIAQVDVILSAVMVDTFPNGMGVLTPGQLRGDDAVSIALNYNCYPCRINNVEILADFGFQYGEFPTTFLNIIGVYVAEAVRFTGLEMVVRDPIIAGWNGLVLNSVNTQIGNWGRAMAAANAVMAMPQTVVNWQNRWHEIMGGDPDVPADNYSVKNIIQNWSTLTRVLRDECGGNEYTIVQVRTALRNLFAVQWVG